VGGLIGRQSCWTWIRIGVVGIGGVATVGVWCGIFPCLEPGRAARRVDCAGETERDGGICGRCPGRAA